MKRKADEILDRELTEVSLYYGKIALNALEEKIKRTLLYRLGNGEIIILEGIEYQVREKRIFRTRRLFGKPIGLKSKKIKVLFKRRSKSGWVSVGKKDCPEILKDWV